MKIKNDRTIPVPNEFDDDNDYWTHPIYDRCEANRMGIITHIKHQNPLGNRDSRGYYQICIKYNDRRKNYKSHRFIFECFHGIIIDKRVVDHINNIKTDNRLDNLQLLTNRENCKKDARKRQNLPLIKIRAINTETGESFDYESINKAGKDLIIHPSIICHIIKGIQKTSLSKKYNKRFTFEKLL